MRLSNLALLSVASAALQLPHRAWPRAAASCRHSAPLCQFQTGKGEPIGDKAEKRHQLKVLFGDATADKLAPLTPSERAEAEIDEILMLQEGMQKLSWGGIRLVDVAMAPGPLELSVEPMLMQPTQLLCARLDMPLGLLLEEEQPGVVRVVELLDGGSAAAGGVQVGDALRAMTAVTMGMSYPTWQLMLGGVGTPQMQKKLIPVDVKLPFEQVMAALGSNAREAQGNGQVILLLERGAAAPAAEAEPAP